MKGGAGARFKRPFPPSFGPEDCTGVTYQLVLRTVRFDASHLSANPWEGALLLPPEVDSRSDQIPVA